MRQAGNHRHFILAITTLASFLTPFTSASINVALPQMGTELGANTVVLSWIPLAFLLAAVVSLVPCGRLADMYGMRRIFVYGIGLFTAASVGCWLSHDAWVLISMRAVQGVGGSMMFGTSIPMLTAAYPPEARGRILGINVASVYLGLSVGPFLGGFLTQYAGWRSLFVASALPGIVVIVLVLTRLREQEERGMVGERFDVRGALAYGVSLVSMMYGLSLLPSTTGLVLGVAGAAGLWIFVKWQSRLAAPMLDVGLFRGNTVFAFSNLAALINYSATFAVTFLLSMYLQYVKGLSPRDAGIILVAQPIVMTLVSPAAGRLSDRVDARLIASVGMGFSAAGLMLMVFIGNETSIAWVVMSLVVVGSGFGLFSSPNTNAVMGSVERRQLGVASAMLGTMRLTGQMFSMGIAMLLLALFVGKVQMEPGLYPALLRALRAAFIIFALLCVGGVFASLARGKAINRPPPLPQ